MVGRRKFIKSIALLSTLPFVAKLLPEVKASPPEHTPITHEPLSDADAMARQLRMFKLWQDPTFPKNPWRLAEELNLHHFGRKR